jgi:hypothetical protein
MRNGRGAYDVSTVEKSRVWWKPATWFGSSRALSDSAAWLLSLLIHMGLIIGLGTLTLAVATQNRSERIEVSLAPPDASTQIPEEFHYSATPPDADSPIGAMGAGGLADARPSAPVQAAESKVAYAVPQAVADVVAPAPGAIEVRNFNRTILEGPNLPENVIIKGAGSVGTTGAMGAIDRITHEILLSLDERPTLVAWLFDESGSLKPQREAIANRFDRIYKELGVIEKSGKAAAFKQKDQRPLLTAIAQFGEKFNLITAKPTDDVSEIKSAVRRIKDDDTGHENVFQSIGALAEKFRHYRVSSPRRNVMIVVFTDEAGDDIQALDAAVDVCRKYEMPVYVIGVPAPFGRENAYVTWVDPDPKFDQTPQKAPVHQGPESLLPERLMLLFGGTAKNEVQVDSGFGPFGLSRVAYETGGLYFAVHPDREKGKSKDSDSEGMKAMASHLAMFFDPRVMRNYRPEYVSSKEYFKLLQNNKACAALVEASKQSATTQMENVRRRFPRIDDAQFARDLSNAQRSAARLEPKIEELVTILRQGERDRDKVKTPRWQAGYDLAIGRALAVKVRTEGYNAMLANAKQGLKFKDPKDDTWDLQSTDSSIVNSALEKDAEDARKYLNRVAADHKGTPWAVDAERELRDPLGWEWHEMYTGVAERIARNEKNRNRPKPERKEPPKKPRRDPPPL